MQFEINDQVYFVNFLPSEGRWYLFTSTGGGMIKIPVAMDAAPFENFAGVRKRFYKAASAEGCEAVDLHTIFDSNHRATFEIFRLSCSASN